MALSIALPIYVRWLYQPLSWIPEQVAREGVAPAPEWFKAALQALPRRRVNASEREVLRRDGAILVKDLVPNRELLEYLHKVVGDKKHQYHTNWFVNGHVHALAKYGPLAELSATALDIPEVILWNTQLEPRPAKSERTWPMPEKPWYDAMYSDPRDQSVHEDTDGFYGNFHSAGHFVKPLASVFLALTDIPHGFELLAGSHVANRRHGCRRGADDHVFEACMDRLEQDCNGSIWWDLKVGDAVFFYGSIFHWSVLQENPRVAFSIRYAPADMKSTGFSVFPELYQWTNWGCGPVGDNPAFPIMYSNDSSRMRDYKWPLLVTNRAMSPLFWNLEKLQSQLGLACPKIYEI